MFQTQDGKKFGSRFKQRKYDEMHATPAGKDNEKKKMLAEAAEGDSAQHEAKESKQFEAGEQEGMQESAHPVVAQHGKAHHVKISHDHANRKHSVKSHHEDGHVEQQDFDNPQAANDHAAQMGGGVDMPEESDNGMGGDEFANEAEPAVPAKLPRMA